MRILRKSEKEPSGAGRSAAMTNRHRAPHGIAQLQRSLGNRAIQSAMIAKSGIAGPAGPMPHLGAIQSSFGRHDLSIVKAHTGTQATAANRALDALAYTTRNHVAFAGIPNLHTAAHEAAHVIQQQGMGFNLKDALLSNDDPNEREADAIADLVVQGKSVERFLGQNALGSTNTERGAIQRQPDKYKPVKDEGSSSAFQWPSTGYTAAADKTYYAAPAYLIAVGQGDERSLDDVSNDIRGIGSRTDVSSKGDIKFGTFAKVKLDVHIPTEVPSLMIEVDLEGKYANEGKNQELEIKLAVGIDWLSLITVKESKYLKLEGDDLGAAFVDALKQITRQIMIEYGVEPALAMLASSKKDRVPFLSLFWSQDEFRDLYKRYCIFFKDNPKVGFEVGSGLELGLGTDDAKGTFEKIEGIEDVDKVRPTVFTELALGHQIKIPPDSKLDFRLAWRSRRDGSQVRKFELEGEIPGFGGDPDGIAKRVKQFIKAGTWGSILGTAAWEGETPDTDALALTLRATLPDPSAKDKFGFSLSFEKTEDGPKSTWKAKVRIKVIESLDSKWTGSKVGKALKMTKATDEQFARPKLHTIGVGLDIDYGTFIDISAEIEAYLNEEEKAQSNAKPVGTGEPLIHPVVFGGLDTNPALGAMQRAQMRAKQGPQAKKSTAPN